MAAGPMLAGGRPTESIPLLTAALERQPEKSWGRPLLNQYLGRAHLLLNEPMLAIHALEEAQRCLDDAPSNADTQADLHGLRGQCYLAMGVLDRASYWHDQEWAVIEGFEIEDPTVVTNSVLNSLNLKLAQGRFESAAREAEAALEGAQFEFSPPSDRALLQVLHGQALAFQSSLEPDLAAAAIVSLELARELQVERVNAPQLLAPLALALLNAGRDPEAEEVLAELAGLITEDELRNNQAYSDGYATAHAWISGHRSVKTGTLAAESAKILRETLARRILVWRTTERRPGGLGFLAHQARRDWFVTLARVEAMSDAEGSSLRVLALWLEAFSASSGLSNGPAPESQASSASAEIAALPPGTTVIWMPGSDGGQAVAYESGSESARLIETASISDIRAAALEHAYELELFRGDPSKARLESERSAAGVLAECLALGPLLGDAPEGTTLTVIGRELLPRIELELLPGRDDLPIACHWALQHWSSTRHTKASIGPLEHAGGDRLELMVLAGTQPNAVLRERWSELVELPWTERHVDLLTGGFGQRESAVFEGLAANLDALSNPNRPAPTCLQLLCHGVTVDSDETPGRLVLNPTADHSGLVTVSDIDQLPRPLPSLVLLSACSSGQAPTRMGAAMGARLGGAFLRGGSDTILDAAGPVPFEATVDLTGHLLTGVREGLAPAEALRRARAALFASSGIEGLAPTAALQLWGQGQRPLYEPAAPRAGDNEPRSTSWVLGVLAIVVACAGGALLARRRA